MTSKKYKIPGFAQLAQHRETGRGGGIAIYFKGAFNVKVQDTLFSSAETLQLKINEELHLLAIYKPPNTSKKTLIDEIDKHLKKFASCGRDFLIVGDINMNLLDLNDKNIDNYENSMSEFGFDRCIFSPTREEFSGGRFSSTLIDHVYHKFFKFHNMSTVLTTKISDHYATCTILHTAKSERASPKFIDKINIKEVNKMIKHTKWTKVISAEVSVHEACSLILQKKCMK